MSPEMAFELRTDRFCMVDLAGLVLWETRRPTADRERYRYRETCACPL